MARMGWNSPDVGKCKFSVGLFYIPKNNPNPVVFSGYDSKEREVVLVGGQRVKVDMFPCESREDVIAALDKLIEYGENLYKEADMGFEIKGTPTPVQGVAADKRDLPAGPWKLGDPEKNPEVIAKPETQSENGKDQK